MWRAGRVMIMASVPQGRRIAAYGVCVDSAGRVLLVRMSAHSDMPGVWGLPGGGVHQGEHPTAALRREFAEETGLTIRMLGLRSVESDVALAYGGTVALHSDRVCYDVQVKGGELANEEGGSTDLARWIEPDVLPTLPLVPFVARELDVPHAAVSQSELPRSHEQPPDADRRQRFAAYGLVTDPDGRVLLTRIAEGYPGAGRWHLPGGGTDHGESPADGLLRELREETGQHGEVAELLDVSHFHNPTAFGPERRPIDWHTVRVLYRVRVPAPTPPRVNEARGGSTAVAQWFTVRQARGLRLNSLADGALTRFLD